MNDYIKTIVKAGILFWLTVLIYFLAVGCEKVEPEPVEPQCQCYEQHEVLEPVIVNGLPTLAWIIDYETPPQEMDCSSETEYTSSNNSERWKVVCQ